MGMKSLMVSLTRQFAVNIILGWILTIPFGAAGIWLAYPVAELLGAAAAVIFI